MIDPRIKKALEFEPHEDLHELIRIEEEKARANQPTVTAPVPKVEPNLFNTENTPQTSPDGNLLAYDIISAINSTYKQRGERLNISMRRLKKAMNELVSKELVKEIWLGKSLYLAPSEKLFTQLGMISPYKRNVSLEHSFLTLLTQQIVECDPMIQRTAIEVPVGNHNCTADLLAYYKNGDRYVYEITRSSSNVCANASKFIGQGFTKIIFLCRDHNMRESVKAILNGAGYDPEFSSTLESIIFSALIRENKKFNRKG